MNKNNLTYNEKKAWNAALLEIRRLASPDKLIYDLTNHLAKPVDYFILTDETMTADCPNCGKSWKGQSYFDLYKVYFEEQKIEISDQEIWDEIKERHKSNYSGILFHIANADKYVCPFCASVFSKE